MKQNTSPCILQVEDDEHDVYFLRHALNRAGITNPIRVVTDGEQAISYLAGEESYANRREYPLPDLILLDLKLPRRSGLEVLQWVREQPALRGVVVVVFTSSPDPVDVQRCYELGANSFVTKPLDMVERVEFARVLKAWWLGYNHFAPPAEVNPHSISLPVTGCPLPKRSLPPSAALAVGRPASKIPCQ